MRKIFVIGHRGSPCLAPENTIPSFKKAIEAGVDFIELDVRATKDNVLVIMHDPTVERTTDGTGKVSELTLTEILKLDAGSWFDEKYKGTRVPTLREVFKELGNSVSYVIELKVKGIEKQVVNLVKEFNLMDEVIILSSIWDSLKRVKELESQLAIMADLPNPTLENLAKVISQYANIVSIHKAKLKREFVERCHKRGLLVNAWPINTFHELVYCVRSEVDFITTDNPGLIVNALTELSA